MDPFLSEKIKSFYKILVGNSLSALKNVVAMNNIGKPKSEQDENNQFFR